MLYHKFSTGEAIQKAQNDNIALTNVHLEWVKMKWLIKGSHSHVVAIQLVCSELLII